MKFVVRGDVDGFFAIALDNLVNLLVIGGLCTGVLGFSPHLIYGRMLPGVAVSFLVGNLFYAWQARRLARREGRDDVCALPFGLNTPTFIAFIFFVMVPARDLAVAHGAADPQGAAWRAGLVACIVSGLIEFLGAFFGDVVRRHTPRAALIAALAGIGLAYLSLSFLFQSFARPVVGLVTLGLVFLFYFGGRKPRGGIPPAMVVLLVGIAVAWASGLFPHGAPPISTLGFHFPTLALGELWDGLHRDGFLLPSLSVALPFACLNLISSLQCVESAAAAGDSYSTRSSLAANGLGTLAAAAFGSPFPTSLYLGHPGWKKMGARSGYSTLNGIFITLLCLSGGVSLLAWLVPVDAGIAIIVWIGIIIAAQSFEATPRAHWPAVVVGMIPVLLAWVSQVFKAGYRLGGGEFSPDLLARLHDGYLFYQGGFSVEQGTFYCSILLSSMTVCVIANHFRAAAIWAAVGAVLSLLGLMHSWRFGPSDTVSSIPLLDAALGLRSFSGSWAELFPAWQSALGYAVLSLILACAPFLTERDPAQPHEY